MTDSWSPRTVDCIIVGGGPAGLTAATYLRRFHRSVIVFDDGRSRARWIPETHNCPGFPNGVSGAELLERLRLQATGYGARILDRTITSLQRVASEWHVGDGTRTWSAQQVILATGVEDELPRIAGDCASAIKDGLLRMCAICDGYEATDSSIAVVGPLEKALAHACFLRTFSAKVTAVPTDEVSGKASDTLIELERSAQSLRIPVTAPLKTLSFRDGTCTLLDQAGASHAFDTAYVALGSPGRLTLARQAGAELREAEILTDAHMSTSAQGIYAIGDVVTDLNQIAVAFGHAAIAATAVHRALPQRPRA